MNRIVLLISLWCAVVAGAAQSEVADFTGAWSTTYGTVTFRQSDGRVSGDYLMEGERCLVQGTVQGRRLTFTYREPYAEGEGYFDLAEDGNAFEGNWKAKGASPWSRWTGKRSDGGTDAPVSFEGVWNSSYGPLRLRQNGSVVKGFYRMGSGIPAEVSGDVKGRALILSYDENGVKGHARFELDPDGASFSGTWEDEKGMSGEWTGVRMEENPGRVWLIVLEARWEASLSEKEYAYGNMLASYFARLENVECRHRYFDDAESLMRACSEIPFLAGPVVVALASHGSEEGIVVGTRTIAAADLAKCFRHADNMILLHFSSCLVLAGPLGNELLQSLPSDVTFPISGYTTAVDWGGSAIAEFLYLDLILSRGEEPAEAAKQLVALMPVAGDKAPANAPFDPLGFKFMPAQKMRK